MVWVPWDGEHTGGPCHPHTSSLGGASEGEEAHGFGKSRVESENPGFLKNLPPLLTKLPF